MATSPNDTTTRYGWVGTPNERGTLDIIWVCVSALFFCLWSMLHLNIPAPQDTLMTKWMRKSRWLTLGILAPELPMLFASGQWSSARRSIADMHELGHYHWTIQHGFYADMGGFFLQPNHSDGFPLSAKQLQYLVKHGYIPCPSITFAEICDKSKGDVFLKGIAFFQTGWLVIQSIARAVQHLPVTPIELSTIAMAFTSLATLLFWWNKPLDVEIPTILFTQYTVTQILDDAGSLGKEPWQDTPLDFVESDAYISRKWNRQVLHLILRLGLQTSPITRISNDRDPQASNLREHLLLAVFTATFASIHFLGWNDDFATIWDAWLWRGSCLAMWSLLATYGTSEVVMCYMNHYQKRGLESGGGYKMRWPACLLFFVPATLYTIARVGLLVEALASMRSLPAAAYQDVQWSAFIPHLR